jgi:uroporphyrinogen decarboxylase
VTSRELVKKTLAFQNSGRIPRDLWLAPGLQPEAVRQVLEHYPSDFVKPSFRYGKGRRQRKTPGKDYQYTDSWGCIWRTENLAYSGHVVGHPLADWSDLESFQPPWEVLEETDFSQIDNSLSGGKYMLAPTEVTVFERLQHLRGTEKLLLDLAYGDEHLLRLIELIHQFNCQELEMWAETQVDGIFFMDDWGWQGGLLISPELWRKYFKPLYKEYCRIIKKAGKDVFFHSDGKIEELFGEFVDLGVDAINSQLFCMDLKKLSSFRGRITFWGEMDRQYLLPYGEHCQIKEAVESLKEYLWHQGGLIAQCHWEPGVSEERIRQVCAAWED